MLNKKRHSLISKNLYFFLLSLALLLIALQLGSGIWLFTLKYGITPSSVNTYFTGNEELFIMAKSFEGLIETAVPHFLAISLTIFVYGHFLLFTKIISERQKWWLLLGLFTSASIDIFSPFAMIHGFEIFAWIKILSFWIFEILMAALLYILFLVFLRSKKI